MQLITIFTVSATILASVDAFPALGSLGLKIRAAEPALFGDLTLHGHKANKAATTTTTTSSSVTKTTTTKASTATTTATGVAAADAATTATSTVDVDPDFDLAAATSAEAAASAAATSLAASANEIKVASLITASTAVQKLDILSDDADWKFDFNTEAAGANGLGGTIVTANLASFPVTQMTGTSMAIGVMGPCGFATPHSHPRASELNLVTQGTLISTMTLENNARVINQTITFQQMTVFPQGSMHMEYNPGCTNATFVAAFTNQDAGVQQSMTAFVNFGDQVIEATMGGALTVNGEDVDVFKSAIPVNVALGVESCLAACGLKKRSLVESRAVLKRGLQQRSVAVDAKKGFWNGK